MVAAMNLTRDTLKTYFRRIIDKLVLDGQPGVVRRQRDGSARCGGLVKLNPSACRGHLPGCGLLSLSRLELSCILQPKIPLETAL